MKIDKGVPVPPKRSKYRDLIEQMAESDSILFETEVHALAMRSAMTNLGISSCMRKVHGGWRVWRLAVKKSTFGLRAVG